MTVLIIANKIIKVLTQIAERIKSSDKIVVFTGAGISKDSGIQTFRDADGLWKNFDPQKLATLDGFLKDPVMVWKWYISRIEKIKQAEPNMGHYFVSHIEKINKKTFVITQNIDGLHKKAGSKNVIELHGNVETVKCLKCSFKTEFERVDFSELPPRCSCGSYLRPDVVWFGEALPYESLTKAFNLAEIANLVITIGTSNLVYPAAEIPFIAKRKGSFIIEINPEKTVLTPYADIYLNNPNSDNYEKLISLLSTNEKKVS